MIWLTYILFGFVLIKTEDVLSVKLHKAVHSTCMNGRVLQFNRDLVSHSISLLVITNEHALNVDSMIMYQKALCRNLDLLIFPVLSQADTVGE